MERKCTSGLGYRYSESLLRDFWVLNNKNNVLCHRTASCVVHKRIEEAKKGKASFSHVGLCTYYMILIVQKFHCGLAQTLLEAHMKPEP